jgi:hypothetical protein
VAHRDVSPTLRFAAALHMRVCFCRLPAPASGNFISREPTAIALADIVPNNFCCFFAWSEKWIYGNEPLRRSHITANINRRLKQSRFAYAHTGCSTEFQPLRRLTLTKIIANSLLKFVLVMKGHLLKLIILLLNLKLLSNMYRFFF